MSAPDPLPPPRRAARGRPALLGLLLGCVALLALVPLAAPKLRWLIHVTRAGDGLAQGLAWPEPRQSDSLPEAGDEAALERALRELAAAQRAWPTHPHAYRLEGQLHTARGDWQAAAAALEQARQRAPLHPLTAWEASLVYEQQRQETGSETARAAMQQAWRDARLDAPQFLARGDEAGGDSAAALRWYTRAALAGGADEGASPLVARLAQALAANDATRAAALEEIMAQVEPLDVADAENRVTGERFRWVVVPPGKSVAPGALLAATDEAGAVEVEPGSEAAVLVEVPQGGAWVLRASLRPTGPPPALGLGVDWQMVSITPAQESGAWQTVEVPVTLDVGLHAVRLTVASADLAEGQPQTIELRWAELRPAAP